MNNKTLVVYTGNICNNNCIICSVRKEEKQERNVEQIINYLKKGREDGFEKVEFTGGEPTIREDIFELIKTANNFGYDTIGLSTNGRMFQYEDFCKKIIESGLNRVTFSLLGSKKEVHDAITRTPGSFDDIMQGVENIKKHINIYLNISTAVNKLNIKNLIELNNFIQNLGIKHWNLLDLVVEGSAKENYNSLVFNYEDFVCELEKFDNLSKYKEVNFFDFPVEIFSEDFRNKKNIKLISKQNRNNFAKQIGLKST